MIHKLESSVLFLFRLVESWLNRVFDDDWNPMYHLGALSFFFFWIVGVSGIYLYIFFETSIVHAYSSIETITHEQWYLGGIMRSLHRYASDAMAITVTLHLFREFGLGRFTGARCFSWVSGVPLLWFMFAAAIGGYWLVWDQFSQYVAVVTMEWLDWLPNFGDPLARNFLNNATVSDRLFSLLVFLHIGIPLFMMLAMFIHISRVTEAKSNPPKGLAIGTTLALILLSLAKPALSSAPADLNNTPIDIPTDWFFANIFTQIDNIGSGGIWLILVGFSSLLSILPWLKKEKKSPPAVVDPDHCSGCGWCHQDCPFGAVEFGPHPKLEGHRVAIVDPDRCTACGICSGSCPASTPFQHVDELKSGIGIPEFTIDDLKQKTLALLENLSGNNRVMVFGCDKGANLQKIDHENIASISLPCIGFLPPSFVDFILRKKLADGVMVTGCCLEDCFFRSGNKWVEERIEGVRMPQIKTKAEQASESIRIRWAGGMETRVLTKEILQFQAELSADNSVIGKIKSRLSKGRNYVGQALVYTLIMVFIGIFSTSPGFTRVQDGHATVKLSLRHAGQLLEACRTLSTDELSRLPPNMRQAQVCPRERSAIEFQFMVDDKVAYHEVIKPAGLKRDGLSKLYYRFEIPAGQHTIQARLKDNLSLEDYNFNDIIEVKLETGNILSVDFNSERGGFVFTGAKPATIEGDS